MPNIVRYPFPLTEINQKLALLGTEYIQIMVESTPVTQ